ncbi:hypothetical protein [Agrococcus beijingensis]|uniref:hypothetical protein n=1 Tax=Agrococcus beijingensis TaxID=3068634 RepID=UPI002741582F|nr:hypothetical protein [Agrococcus sp. REN33]
MAAHIVALRWRLLLGSLKQSPWAIVALVISVLGAMSLLGTTLFAAIGIRIFQPDLGAPAAVLGGALLVVALTAITVLIGTSDPLAPERFSVLPLDARQLRRGLLAASLLDAWGIVAVLAVVIGLVVWSTSISAMVTAVAALPLAVLTAMLVPRVTADLVARQLASKRARDVMAIVLLLAMVGLVFGMAVVAEGVSELGDIGPALAGVVQAASWTPLGAVFDLPRTVAEGAWPEALAKLAIALGTVALCWWGWGRMLAERLTNPIVLRGGGRVREGGLLDRLLPATPIGAIATRSIRYRRRDVRHLMNVIAVLMVTALIGGMQLLGDEAASALPLSVLPLMMAIIAASMLQLDTAYDNSALAWHLLAGVRGAQDRAGRLLGVSIVFLPLIVLAAVLSAWATGQWHLLPGSLGLGLGTFGLLAGTMLWLSAYLPGEAPEPGANPLGRGSSGGVQSLAGIGIALPVLAIAGLPFIGLAVAAAWIPWFGWLSLAAGLLIGGLGAWLGVRFGGAALDRRGPEVLAKVSRAQ